MSAEAIHVAWGWPQMEEILQCPICFELPIGPVPICTQGHHICTLCRQKVDNCPLCKAQYKSEARNFAIEELLANISIIKNLMTLANITTAPFPDKSNPDLTNTAMAIIRKKNRQNAVKLPAPVQSRGSFPCIFCKSKFAVSLMLNHLRYAHANNLIEAEFTQPFQVTVELKFEPNNSHAVAIRAEKLGVFFLSIETTATKKSSLFLRIVANHADAQKYTYSLKIPNEATNYFGRVWSCREPIMNMIKKRTSRCLVLDSDFMQRVNGLNANNTGKKIKVIVTINRLEEDVPPPTNTTICF